LFNFGFFLFFFALVQQTQSAEKEKQEFAALPETVTEEGKAGAAKFGATTYVKHLYGIQFCCFFLY
jgi:hypothetical protein